MEKEELSRPVVESIDYDTAIVRVPKIGGGFTRLTFALFTDLEYLEGTAPQSLWAYLKYIPSNDVMIKTESARELLKEMQSEEGQDILKSKYGKDFIRRDFGIFDEDQKLRSNHPSEYNKESGVLILRWHPLSEKKELTAIERTGLHKGPGLLNWTPFVIPAELGVTDKMFDTAKDVAYSKLKKIFMSEKEKSEK